MNKREAAETLATLRFAMTSGIVNIKMDATTTRMIEAFDIAMIELNKAHEAEILDKRKEETKNEKD